MLRGNDGRSSEPLPHRLSQPNHLILEYNVQQKTVSSSVSTKVSQGQVADAVGYFSVFEAQELFLLDEGQVSQSNLYMALTFNTL
jgi:hypothetical protein